MAAEIAISSAVQLLDDLLIQKVKSLRGVEEKVQSLKEELSQMQSFLVDANKKQFEDERVRNWISDIREVAQDAEDTIEMFLLNVEVEKSKGLHQRFTSLPKRMYHPHKIGDEIETIRRRLDDIHKSRESFGVQILQDAATDSTRTSQVELRTQLVPWQNEHAVGIEDEVEYLVREMILHEERKGLSVVGIVGMAGCGKSTLARAIFNHPDIVVPGRFDCRAWVVASQGFSPEESIKKLIFQLPRSEQDKRKLRELEETKDKQYILQMLQEILHQQLQGKPYFIVLDNVLDREYLVSLMRVFPNQQDEASTLLVISYSKESVIYDVETHVYQKRIAFTENDSELLLKKTLLGSTNGKFPEEIKSIGKQIIKEVHGLPLAISLVGGILMETQTKSVWENVLNQIKFCDERYVDPYKLLSHIAELSYQNLSSQLKSCFLCLSFFNKYFTIPAERVVNIWVAQGLIQQDGRGTTDEIARGCLNELINRSMVEIEDLTVDDRVKQCSLHYDLRYLCLTKAIGEMGLKILHEPSYEPWYVSLYKPSGKPRHLIVHGSNILEAFSSNQNKHLRSLFLLDVRSEDVYASRYWKSFQLLKTLSLDGFTSEKLPDSLRFLLGLKYFRIRRDQSIIGNSALQLPSWLDHLKKLEVLEVEMGKVLFPDVALKMERLRHFIVHGVEGRKMKVENWNSIESVKLIRLEDLLECSSTLAASSHLRELGLWIAGKEGSEAFSRGKGWLKKMRNLVELHLEITTSFALEDIIQNLDSLTMLKLDCGMLKYCPAASVFPQNLSHLTLCSITYDPMEELGKLTKLQYLTLSSSLNMTGRMKVLHDGFPLLKALSLENMHYLKGIDIQQGGMPLLKKLQFQKCPNLETNNLPKHIIIKSSA